MSKMESIKDYLIEKNKLILSSLLIGDEHFLIAYVDKKGEVHQEVALYYVNDTIVWCKVYELPHHKINLNAL